MMSEDNQKVNDLSLQNISVENMPKFKISYNRHKDQYKYRETDFPQEYHSKMVALEYAKDPDWTVKIKA